MSGCKFCGRRLYYDFEIRDERCFFCRDEQRGQSDAAELARFRAMFPVMPWAEGPITPEVCERLGMVQDGRWWTHQESSVAVFDADSSNPFIRGDGYGKNAGQLACLVAARRKQD